MGKLVEEFVSASQAAQMLGVSRQRVSQLLHAGQLEGTRVGHSWLIPKAKVEARLQKDVPVLTWWQRVVAWWK